MGPPPEANAGLGVPFWNRYLRRSEGERESTYPGIEKAVCGANECGSPKTACTRNSLLPASATAPARKSLRVMPFRFFGPLTLRARHDWRESFLLQRRDLSQVLFVQFVM